MAAGQVCMYYRLNLGIAQSGKFGGYSNMKVGNRNMQEPPGNINLWCKEQVDIQILDAKD